MKKTALAFLLALASFFLLVGCGGGNGLYHVQRVVDGDTIQVKIGNKEEAVRLIGVDTPETKAPGKPVEPYGPEAAAFTERLVEGKKVRLELDVQERDKYGRILAYVYLEEGTFVNAELLRQGYARLLTIPPNVRYADTFVRLEREAREARRGLWGLEPGGKTGPAGNQPQQAATGKIKGNINSKGEKIYHVPGGAYYDQTVAEEYFNTEEEAQAAGYRKSTR
ncbi:hypothetical protein SY88_05140 [Clostridiales bacterium PH28_bin88]|nr:hypothetical protein SY88_05140 [Clostridiales bacterium PH28_bin88]